MSKRQGEQQQEDDRKPKAPALPERRRGDNRQRALSSSNEVTGRAQHPTTSSAAPAAAATAESHHQQQHQQHHQHQEQHLGTQPLPSDIILGRGRLHAKNKGNAYYYETLDSFKSVYRVAKTKGDKTRIVRNIYQHLSERGSRFLKKSDSGACFYVLGEILAKKKIGHGIRFRMEVGERPEMSDEEQDSPNSGGPATAVGSVASHSFQTAPTNVPSVALSPNTGSSLFIPPPVAAVISHQVPGNRTLSITAGFSTTVQGGVQLGHTAPAIAPSSSGITLPPNNRGADLSQSSEKTAVATTANFQPNQDSPMTSSSSSSSPSQRRRRPEEVQGPLIDRGSSSSNRSFSSISSFTNSGIFSPLELAQ
eukprot:scaffold34606_cov192-Amphora_coffeaeformis.AAC.18